MNSKQGRSSDLGETSELGVICHSVSVQNSSWILLFLIEGFNTSLSIVGDGLGVSKKSHKTKCIFRRLVENGFPRHHKLDDS